MNLCTFCKQPYHGGYRVVDIRNNRAIAEYCLCDFCGAIYTESLFVPPAPPPPKLPKSKPTGKHVPINVISTAAQLLALLLDKTDPMVAHRKYTHSPCPRCGHTIGDLQAKGRFGCPQCYKHFDDTIVDIVDIAQKGARKHIGKSPKNFVNSQDAGEKLRILKLRLASAIEHEQFEDAAKLRDQLKALEH
jgi:protein-arginine kinase activator protein McsA